MATIRVTKKLLRSMLDVYIDDATKPTIQTEPRLNDYYDKRSIIDEMYLSMEHIHGMRTENDVRRVFYLFMFMAEEYANEWKRWKVINEDVAFAFKVFSRFAGRAKQDTNRFKRLKEVTDEVARRFTDDKDALFKEMM